MSRYYAAWRLATVGGSGLVPALALSRTKRHELHAGRAPPRRSRTTKPAVPRAEPQRRAAASSRSTPAGRRSARRAADRLPRSRTGTGTWSAATIAAVGEPQAAGAAAASVREAQRGRERPEQRQPGLARERPAPPQCSGVARGTLVGDQRADRRRRRWPVPSKGISMAWFWTGVAGTRASSLPAGEITTGWAAAAAGAVVHPRP